MKNNAKKIKTMQESKKCSRCKEEKPLTGFYKSKTQKGGYQAYCKICNLNNLNKKYPTLNVEKRREGSRRTMLKSKYGLSLEEYNKMLESQNGVCAICLKPETSHSNKKGPIDSLRVDHCHKTGKVRGLLCSECNFGISKFNDSMGLVCSALAYLHKHKK